MSAFIRWNIVAIIALASGAVTSQTVYRCGNVYSRDPCPGAKAIEVDGQVERCPTCRSATGGRAREASGRRDGA